jgi:hypothetical protein
MTIPQVCVVGLLVWWGAPIHGLAVTVLVLLQLMLMRRFLVAPIERALFYSGVGIPLYVSGMMVSAFALRGLGVGP